MRKTTFRIGLTLIAILQCAVMAQADELGATIAKARCAACHGVDGRGISGEYPSLAGQHAEYLVKQIFNFKTGQRLSPLMQPVVNELKAVEIRAVTTHFSRLPARKVGMIDASLREAGRELYERGNPATGVTACQSCHGVYAIGGAQLPRLVGQNQVYLERQMQDFKQRTRINDRMMHIGLATMTDREMVAVAAYLAGQD